MKIEEKNNTFTISWVTEIDGYGFYVWLLNRGRQNLKKAPDYEWMSEPVGGAHPPKHINDRVQGAIEIINKMGTKEYAGMTVEDLFNATCGGASKDDAPSK